MMHRGHSWLYIQNLLLVVLGEPYDVPGSNLGELHLRQVKYPLYYCFGTLLSGFKQVSSQWTFIVLYVSGGHDY